MEILTSAELRLRKKEIIKKIREGSVFIYPTDTIYGLGGNALLEKTVQKIRSLKSRFDKPLSIWVPGLDWVTIHCILGKKEQEELKKLPGPYTLILPLQASTPLAPAVTLGKTTIGIRFPRHWFGNMVKEAGVPIITTSANKSGQPFMTELRNLDKDIEQGVEFIIYEGEKEGRPSQIIHPQEGKIHLR